MKKVLLLFIFIFTSNLVFAQKRQANQQQAKDFFWAQRVDTIANFGDTFRILHVTEKRYNSQEERKAAKKAETGQLREAQKAQEAELKKIEQKIKQSELQENEK